jgi:hypothetical protein
MKSTYRSSADDRRFPLTDYSYHAGLSHWRGHSFPYDGDDERRRFHDFSREFLLESARERAKEMAVFAIIVVASAWPVVYMVVSVIKLLLKGRPLTE